MMEAAAATPDNKPPATNAPPATAAVKPATNAPPAAAVPPIPPEYFNRYGKILTSGDEPSHPLKLMLPFPGVGEVKVPNQDEINMREKLEALAVLSDDDIRTQLSQWPAYSKMKLADEGVMLMRIQQLKDRRNKIALEKARQMGLSTLTKEQQARFEQEYWDKRLKMDQELAKQFGPIVKDREAKMEGELFREFSAPPPTGGAIVQAPKPPSAPATNAAPAQPKSPVASTPVAMPPVAQGVKPPATPPPAH